MSAKPASHTPSVRIPKPIRTAARILELTSPKLAAKFAIKLFMTPVKYPAPKREREMDEGSMQKLLPVPAIGKNVNVYLYGAFEKKVLLVHGWSGRGTQLCSIAERLLKCGYSTVSFDGPAHGKSTGKTSDMTEFIAAIKEIEVQFGPFDFAIGHSLGGMAVLNALKQGLDVNKAVIIGSGDIITDIIDDFIHNLGMNIETGKLMLKLFEKKFGETANDYSAYVAAQHVTIPVLVIHDEDDTDVPVSAARHIAAHLPHGRLMITQGLGHRKILGDAKVIKTITEFLTT